MKATRSKEQLRDRLENVVQRMRVDLDRVEILAAACGAFSRPVPDYKPEFRHLEANGQDLARFEIAS